MEEEKNENEEPQESENKISNCKKNMNFLEVGFLEKSHKDFTLQKIASGMELALSTFFCTQKFDFQVNYTF